MKCTSCEEFGITTCIKHRALLEQEIADDIKDEVAHVISGKKDDGEKPRLDLVPKSLIWAVGEMLTVGAKKYGTHNWLNGLAWSRPYAAVLRHLTAWQDGEDIDADSGKSHLWCAATEIAFLIEYQQKGIGQDDRYKK